MAIQCLDYKQGNLVNAPYSYIMAHNRALSSSLHMHTFYEIVLIISGTVDHLLADVRHTLGDGDLVFINPYESHQYRESSPEIDLLSLQVSCEEMQRFLDTYQTGPMLGDPNRVRFITLSNADVRAISDLAARMMGRTANESLALYRMLLGRIMHCYLNWSLQGGVPSWLRMAMEQMRSVRNACEGVSAFLRLSNLSHAQLCRLMKKYCGVTPQQYVKDLRLNLAYQMIETTNTDFMTISMDVGYNSFSHFCSTFKEKYGISPSELRRQTFIRLGAFSGTKKK